jgi:excisionase family DNA binding protein
MQKRNTPACVSTHNKTPERRLVDGNQMADAISVSTKTLQRLRNEGVIGFYRIGRTIRYDLAEVMESLADYHVISGAQVRPKASYPR